MSAPTAERTTAPPTPATGVRVDDAGVLVPGAPGPLVLRVDGTYVWSFTPARDGRPERDGLLVAWPPVLRPYLKGRARVTVTDVPGSTVLHDAEVSFGGGAGPVAIVDSSGHPLCVDKVGHLTRSFADTAHEVREEILLGTQRALRDLREGAGVEAYLNYGALLGAVRDGAMIAHDSDTDVCYVSKHESPADVIAESYRVEREMLRRGWSLLRMSGGDIKLLLPLSDGRNCHIDVFVAFWVRGTFYQLGNRSGQLERSAVLPLSTIELHGHTFPAPADPEAMLAFVYGPGWRVPDPSFTYADPRAGVRRLDGWLRGFRTHMGRWTEFHIGPGRQVRLRRSPFAVWVRRQVGAGDPIADIGAGAGCDALFYGRKGHPVRAYDYSRVARSRARGLTQRNCVAARIDKLILGELRTVLLTGAELARDPHHLTARLVLGALEDHERDNFWRLARMALRGSDRSLFVEFSARVPGVVADDGSRLDTPGPDHLVHRLSPRTVRREVEAAGGVVELVEIAPGLDVTEAEDPAVCRMRITFPAHAVTSAVTSAVTPTPAALPERTQP
ncbi:class I SAM-dependent methyltransferase [Nocardioides daphniae]|uniref:Class I SAM-dependent methyltransferase n=1 Tax=Nocardioides daphniae TaxID=402297 RepID=A0ABQ1PW96_9ACTN|nr:class I SAM-dependent methyltransferase [Nocardioides daphniae]GGD05479.1 hypothetical protein GCM10007231_00330 [Nocardioides daphniae]